MLGWRKARRVKEKQVLFRLLRPLALGALAAVTASQAATADPVADFYARKTIRVLIGYSTGGGYDLYARLLAKYMGRHIPGSPTLYTTTFFLAMNKGSYERLSDDQRGVLDKLSGMHFANLAGEMWDAVGKEVGDKVKADGKGTVSAISEEEKARWIEATKPVHAKWVEDVKAKGLDGDALIKTAQELIAKYGKDGLQGISIGNSPGQSAISILAAVSLLEGKSLPDTVELPNPTATNATLKAGVNYYPKLSDNFFTPNQFPPCGVNISGPEIMAQPEAK